MNVARDPVHGEDELDIYDGQDHAELELTDDESLPWLESDDYEDENRGVDTGRIIGFAAMLLLLLALLVGGLWWMTNRNSGEDAIADGRTIEAPEGDYKVRPENAGGKEFAGTGNAAPAVGEGQTPEATLAENGGAGASAGAGAGSGAAAAGSSGGSEGGAPGGAGNGEASQAAAGTGGVGVQVGAFGSQARAETGWNTLKRQTNALNGVKYRIVKGTADIGTVYRLQAITGDGAAADRLCNALKADGLPCQVKR
jgi:hypothetical protein